MHFVYGYVSLLKGLACLGTDLAGCFLERHMD